MYGLSISDWGRRNVSLKEDVAQSLAILLKTRKGEKIWDPDYGCDAVTYLDRPSWCIQLAMVAILEAVTAYEPRVRLLSMDIAALTAPVGDPQPVRITLKYMLISTSELLSSDTTLEAA